MFWVLDSVGALIMYFSKNTYVPNRALRAQDGSILGPGDPEASTDPPIDELWNSDRPPS